MTLVNNTGNNNEELGNQLFPVFIKLNELHTVLIGAGPVGLEKLIAILNNSAKATITIIAIDVLPEIYSLAESFKGISIHQKAFEASDLDIADIVVAATNNNVLNEEIRAAAKQRKLLVNVADKPALCDFYLGSVVKKGDLKIGISTNGKSPTVAKRIKELLTNALPDELDVTLQQLNEIRNSLTGDFAFKVKELNRITAMLLASESGEEKNTATKTTE
ncbi:precorrin-2 dehydrogenase/sirohydrochlorin ferrochelatase family protein [Mucilaginibacter auburnensis]|uniref:precorrin-2 dehydrogenase n=1 Tax=Mucilaginibacter auburnensis TaxID=1457233 RepID=A0A2H9VLA4_9SPHI|nr:bifunctional precorrin-2 dehydrogenase/sirohydrochlorin ferrochelatase [Mucilaginibacter auburnensis]PJJ79118.1 siroheme synthase-like protein [Mucilaginibacter auburnensis]